MDNGGRFRTPHYPFLGLFIYGTEDKQDREAKGWLQTVSGLGLSPSSVLPDQIRRVVTVRETCVSSYFLVPPNYTSPFDSFSRVVTP